MLGKRICFVDAEKFLSLFFLFLRYEKASSCVVKMYKNWELCEKRKLISVRVTHFTCIPRTHNTHLLSQALSKNCVRVLNMRLVKHNGRSWYKRRVRWSLLRKSGSQARLWRGALVMFWRTAIVRGHVEFGIVFYITLDKSTCCFVKDPTQKVCKTKSRQNW